MAISLFDVLSRVKWPSWEWWLKTCQCETMHIIPCEGESPLDQSHATILERAQCLYEILGHDGRQWEQIRTWVYMCRSPYLPQSNAWWQQDMTQACRSTRHHWWVISLPLLPIKPVRYISQWARSEGRGKLTLSLAFKAAKFDFQVLRINSRTFEQWTMSESLTFQGQQKSRRSRNSWESTFLIGCVPR